MLFKLSNLNSNLALTLGYLNPALNNSAQDCSMKKEKAFCVNLMCSGIIFQNLVLIWLTFFKKEFTNTYIAITAPKGGYPGLY